MKKRDSEVEQQVLRTLKLNSAIGGSELCVESQAGVVTLSGTTTSPHERRAVYEATRDIPGVRGVVNKIEVETYRFFTPEKSLSASTAVRRRRLNFVASPAVLRGLAAPSPVNSNLDVGQLDAQVSE